MHRSSLALVSAGTLLIACSYGFARFAYGLFTPTFVEEFDLTAAIVGAIGSGSYLAYSVAIVASTVLTGRFGPRATAAAAGCVAVLGIALVAAATSAPVLLAGVVIAGSSTGLASPPLAAAVAHWVEEGTRDRAQTVINAGTGFGVILSVPIALIFAEHWRLAWGVMGLIAVGATVFVMVAIPSTSRSASTPVPHPVRRAGSLPLVSASLLVGTSSVAVWNFSREVTAPLGENVSVLAWAMLGAAGVAGAFSGDAVRWAGLTWSWRVAVSAMIVATLGYAALGGSATAVMVAAAAFGAAYIALTGLLLVWATRVYPDGTAFGVGLSFLAIAVGQAISAPLVGAIAEATSLATAFVFSAAAGAMAVFIRPERQDCMHR